MIQTVIFDMDGVIIDSEPIYFAIEKQMFEELEIDIPFAEHCSFVGTSSKNMWQAITSQYGILQRSDELIQKEYRFYMEHLLNSSDLHPIDGVTELIKDFYENNFKLVIASSSRKEIIDIVLERFQLSDYFIATVSGAGLSLSKPHPEIFLYSAKLANSYPAECLVIEDSENGITAAKAAGMKCIGYQNQNSGNQNLTEADIIIKSFNEVNIDHIKGMR